MASPSINQQMDLVQRLKTYALMVNDSINAAMLLRQEALDAGFASGGQNAIVDADLQTRFPNLSITDLTAAFAAFDALNTTLIANNRTHVKSIVKVMR